MPVVLGGKRETNVSTPDVYLENVEAKLVEAKRFLEALESGKVHIGAPFEGRTEAKVYDLRRQIAECEAILDKNDTPRT